MGVDSKRLDYGLGRISVGFPSSLNFGVGG